MNRGNLKHRIVIDVYERGEHEIRVGEKWQDGLCWDEALAVIAAVLMGGPDNPYRPLWDQARHAAYHAALFNPQPRLTDQREAVTA